MSGPPPPEVPDPRTIPGSPAVTDAAGPGEPVDRRGFFRAILRRGMDEVEQIGREAGRKIGDWVSEARGAGVEDEVDQPPIKSQPHEGTVGRDKHFYKGT